LIGLDTNVLLRVLVDDDKAQAAKAAKLIERATKADEPLFVSDVVLCETVWVLLQSYRFSRRQVASILADLFKARQLTFTDSDALRSALSSFVAGKGDFADYLLREQASELGCRTVATFDKALLKEPGFTAP
jgi:predicted nucleic-acid-binding protein